MNVLIIGERVNGGITSSIAHGFKGNGWNVKQLNWPPKTSRTLVSLGFHSDTIARKLSSKFEELFDWEIGSFNLVVVVKGAFFSGALIKRINNYFGCPVICWNPDDPTDPSASNSRALIGNSVHHYDLYVTWSDEVALKLLDKARSVAVIPFGWDPAVSFVCDKPVNKTLEDLKSRFTFVGTWTAERQAWLQGIDDLDPVVFGNDWPKNSGLDIRKPLSGDDLRFVFANSFANLNFLRPQNKNSHNMRTYEILACGGRQIAESSTDHDRIAAEWSNMIVFNDPESLRAAMTSLASPNHPEVPPFIWEHTYSTRIKQLVSQINLGEDPQVR